MRQGKNQVVGEMSRELKGSREVRRWQNNDVEVGVRRRSQAIQWRSEGEKGVPGFQTRTKI